MAQNSKGSERIAPRDFPLLGMQAFSLDSEVMERRYDIIVRFPMAYLQNPEQRFAALVITDGNRFFGGAAAALMAVEAELEEPMILVGVGTPFEEGQAAYNIRRLYEFSPPGWNLKDPFGQTVAQTCKENDVPRRECTGGAPRFLAFLSQELLPFLAGGLRVDPQRLTLGGVSAGGYFAAWTLFQENSPFSNYIISSPAMAYGDGEIFRVESRFASKQNDLQAGVYLASGSRELADPYLEGVGQVASGQARLGGVLQSRNYPSLTLHSEIHQGLGHLDVIPVSYARGLRLLFGKP
ncbi:alpha/beta hydrolase [Parahaliea mediterranea]|uniref:alpha/beta hydrolase n=1 Tax=Parahaliea mediterranea TaxID=651086 RepID=UPI00130083C9|nr:alpha/beta hydrolase-fold protein [Parahaliea mediterranea]